MERTAEHPGVEPSPADRPGGWLRCAGPAVLVAFAAIACFGATLGHGLVQDDVEIRTSPLLGRPLDVLAVWRGGYLAPGFHYEALYRPLAQWTLLLNAGANELLSGDPLRAAGFHAGNLLLHAAACLALLAWLRTLPLPRGAPFAGALLFAVHPVHTEAVANVSARSEPLALLLGLAFLLAHGRRRPVLAGLLLLLALWSKESAVGFAGLAVLSDLLLRESSPPDPRSSRSDRPSRRSWILYAGVLALWLGLRAAALRGRSPEIAFLDNPAASASGIRRILTALAVQLDYLRLLVWPVRQSIDYGFAVRTVVEGLLDARVLLFLAIAAAAIAIAWRLRRRAPAVALAVGGYALLFAVSSNVLFPIGSIEAERLAYAPSAFACMLAGALLVRLPREVLGLGLAGLAGALGAKSWNESLAWRSESTLYRAAVEKAGASAKAQMQLGEVLEREGDLDGAARRYEASTAIYPDYGPAWFLQGNALHRLGRTEEGIRAWRSALAADPGLADVRANLCNALLELDRRDEAVAEARTLFAADPLHEKLPELQERLAHSAPESEVLAARALLAGSRKALADGDAARALKDAQSAILSGALPREDRREALLALAEAWRRTGRSAGAQKFSAAAERLTP